MIRIPLISRRRGDAAERAVPAAPAPPPTAPIATVPREILRQVRLIELRTRGLVNSIFGGEYQSVFRGQGMEFAEVREYQHGDDVRNIDWNVTARTGHPYVKKHVEERELTVFLLLDLSGSEQFGTRGRFKAELAAEIAAVLALSAVRNNDRVGLLIFTDRIEHAVPARKGKRHVLRLIRDVLAFQPVGRGTDLPAALNYAARLLPHRGILFVLSDFVPPADAGPALLAEWEKGLRLISRRHDIVAVEILDAAEVELPDAGVLVVTDPESGREYVIDTGDPELRDTYAADVSTERGTVQRMLRRLGIDEIRVRTDEPFVGPLLAFFRRRERKQVR